MTRIWWVEDFLSKQIIGELYFATRQEAVDRRNELGYGLVKYFDCQDGGLVGPSAKLGK